MTTLRRIPIAAALLLFGCDDNAAPPTKTVEAKPAPTADKEPAPKDEPAPAAEDEPDADDEPEAGDEPELGAGDEPDADDESDADDGETKVAEALEIAAEIEAKPEDLEQILAEHELTQAQFSALLYEIAEDPALAVLYAEGREEQPEQG
jgi:pilus assembly protein FimV